MTTSVTRLCSALFVAAVFTASAHAEYRCNPPPSSIDRRACEAAEQGPDTLRRFVWRMNWLRANILFWDYVDAKTAQNWDAKRRQTAEKTIEDAQQMASSERR